MKSFKINFDKSKFVKKYQKLFNDFLNEEEWKEEVATLAIRQIKGSTRLKKFIKDDSAIKSLKDSTIEQRKKLAKNNSTGISFGAKKSNLTLSGQLLESLQRIPDKTKVIIKAEGDRKPYVGVNGKPYKNTPTNSELSKYVKDQGRSFISFNEKLKELTRKAIKAHIRRKLFKK